MDSETTPDDEWTWIDERQADAQFAADMAKHAVELRRTYMGGSLQYWGRCACGESSPVYPAAGMVWGWEARHRDSEAT